MDEWTELPKWMKWMRKSNLELKIIVRFAK
jgi:hypothetical protein